MTIKKARKKAKSQSNHLKTRKKTIRKTNKKTQPQDDRYDTNLNFNENMFFYFINRKNLGWMVDINKRVNKMQQVQENNNNTVQIEEEIDLKDLQNGQIILEKKSKKLCQEDKQVIQDMQKKYKDNFEKMFKDIKINKYQWNKNKIQKTYNTYLEVYGSFK